MGKENDYRPVASNLSEVARTRLTNLYFDANASPVLRQASLDALKEVIRSPQKDTQLKIFQSDLAAK